MTFLQIIKALSELLPLLWSAKNIADAIGSGQAIDKALLREVLYERLPKHEVDKHIDNLERILASSFDEDRMHVEINHELAKIVEKVGDIL